MAQKVGSRPILRELTVNQKDGTELKDQQDQGFVGLLFSVKLFRGNTRQESDDSLEGERVTRVGGSLGRLGVG